MPTDIERLLSSGSLKTKDSSPSAAFASRAYELLGSIENAGADALDKTPIPQAIGSNPLRDYAKESNAARDAVGYTTSQSMQNVQQAIADRTKDAGVLDSIIGAASALYDNAGDAYNSIPELIAQSAPDMAMLAAGGTFGRVAGFLLGTAGQSRQNAEERAINNGMDKHQVESANLGDETFDPRNLALAGVSYAMNYADVKILEGAMHAKGVKQLLARNLESPVVESVQEFSQSLTDTYAQTVDTKKGFNLNEALNQAKVEGAMGLLAGHGFEQAGNAIGLVKGGGAKAKELASDKIAEQATTNTGKDMSGLTPDMVQSKIDKNLDTLSKVDIDLAQAESQEDIDALTKIKNQIIARNAILAQQKEALIKEQSKSTTEDSSLKNEPVEAQETILEPEANVAEQTNKSEEKVLSDVSSEDTHVSEVAEEKQNEKVVPKDEVSTKPNKPIEQYKPKDIANLDADRFEELFATSFEKSTEPNTKIGSDVKVSMESRKALQNTGVVIEGKKHPKQKDDGTFFGSPTTDSSIDGIRSNINSETNAFAYMAKKDINKAKIAMQKYFNRMYASTANRTEAKSEAVINARNEEMANFVLLYRTLFGTSPEAKTATEKEVLQLADLKTNKSISEFKGKDAKNKKSVEKVKSDISKKDKNKYISDYYGYMIDRIHKLKNIKIVSSPLTTILMILKPERLRYVGSAGVEEKRVSIPEFDKKKVLDYIEMALSKTENGELAPQDEDEYFEVAGINLMREIHEETGFTIEDFDGILEQQKGFLKDMGNHIILHEYIHVLAIPYMRNNKDAIETKRINALYEKCLSLRDEGKLTEGYWSENVDEFISEATSNPYFIKELSKISPNGEVVYKSEKSILGKLIELISNMFTTSKDDTMFSFLLDSVMSIIEKEENINELQKTTKEVNNTFTNHSGGAIGSDAIWGEIGERFGVKSNHYYKDKTPNGNTKISESDFKEGLEKAKEASKLLGRNWSNKPYVQGLLARNWSQVKYSDAVFAIGEIDGKFVKGGTGYAVAMAIMSNKPVYVFNLKNNQWYKRETNSWVKIDTPVLTNNFAGIGTRGNNGVLPDAAIDAIENVYKKTFNSKQSRKSLLGNPVASPLDAQVADSMRTNTGLPKPQSIFQTPYREETHGLVQDNAEYIFGENTFEKKKDDSNNLYSQTSSALEMFTEIEKSVKDLFHNKFKKAFANTETFSNGGSVGLNSFSFLSDERIAEASFISATLKLSNTNKTEEGYNLVYSIASSIGTDVINMLNLKDSDKASVVKQNAIRMAIGFAAINAMENSGVITIEFVDGKAVAKPTGLQIKLPYELKTHINTQSYVTPRIGSEPKQRDIQTVDKNEHFTATKKQLDGIKKLESVNYRVNTDFVNFLDKMAIDEKDMLEIEGYSNDKSQAQTLDKLREFIGEAGDSIFQYDYKIGTNSRGYIIQNVANFQSDKAFARNLITFEDNKIRNQKVYKAAFVQAFGFKLSEVGMFDSLVQEVENATSRADILALAKKYNGMHTLLAIHDYKDVYLKSDKESSNIYVEVDGKTNGYAFGIMQLKSYDRNKLAQVGLFTPETENVKLDDVYTEVINYLKSTLGKALSGKVPVGMTVQEYYGLKIDRKLIKQSFFEFIYGAGEKSMIANMVDRFTDGKEISPEQREKLTGLAVYIDKAIRQLHPEFVEYTNFVKSVYDLKFAVFNHKFEAFKNEVSKKKNMTVGEYKTLKKELMKYAPSLHAIGQSEENTWKSTDAIPLYKTSLENVVGSNFSVKIKKQQYGREDEATLFLPFRDFMPSAQSSAAAPLITHHQDSVTALGSIAEANQDLMYMYDAAASGMAGNINVFSNLYNDNFIELGRNFDVIEALRLEVKEAMSYIQKNRVALNDKQYKAMVGFDSQYDNLVNITQKNNSKLDELSSVRQMESVETGEEVTETEYIGSSTEEDFSNKIKEFDLVHDSDALTNVFDEVSLFGERASVSHLSYLRDLVSKISNKLGKVTALEKISLYTASSESYGAYDTVSGNIDIAIGETKTYLGMTAAELMAHELVHKATLYAYEYDTRIRAEANKIMQMAKAKMDKLGGFNLLLNKNSRGELIFMYDRKAEILEAKKRYEYIFSDAKEFVAFAGTSEKLMNILSTLDYDGVASTEKTILGKVIDFIQMVLNSFLGKSSGSTLDVRTKTLLASMYETNQRYAPMAIANEMTRYEKLFDTIADKKLVNQLLKMSVMLAKIGGKGVVGIFKFADKVAQITTNKKIMEFKLIKDIVFDLTHGLDKYPAYKALSQYHQKLQSEYNDISNGAKTELKNIMNNASDVTRSAYGLAVVDTDVQSLTRYSTVQKIDLIGKNEYRKKEIEKLETSMRGGISSKDNMRFYNYAVMQARGLGYYMATNITKLENQMLNAQNIASGKYIGLENYGITEEQINHLATLYALEYTNEATRLEVYMHAVENKRAFDDIVKFHAMVAKENKERLFDKYGEGHLFIKGYSKEINSPLVDAVIRNLSQKDEMEKNGYKLVSQPKEGSKLVKPSYEQQDMGVFVRYNIAPRMTEGIMDLINKEAKGTKLDDLKYESTGGLVHKGSMSLVDDVMSKAYAQQTTKLFEVSKLPDISMTPVLSPDGKIVNYRWMMSKNNKQELLKQDKRVDIVLGELYAFSKRKQDAEKLNQETVKQIIKDYSEMSPSEAGDFVEVSSDNLQEIYKLIPKRTVDFIKAETGAKKLMVRKGLLDIIFGYQDASISNIGWIKNSKFAAKIRFIEKIWQDMAAHSREGITIKTPSVIKGNVISNTFTLLFHGMQPDEAITKQIEGVKLLDEYRAMKTEFVSLEIQEKLGKPINKARKETLKKGFEKSPIYKLIKSGQFQSIVDDMSLDKMDTNSLFEMYGDAMLNKLPKKIRNVVDQAYINKDTELFRMLMKTVQYSDFVAKYALYDFFTNKKRMSHHDALNICEKMFVSYAAVQNRYIKWSGDMMFFPFPKYFFRIQKAAIDAAINNPKAVTLGLAGQYITKNISDITDQSMLTYNIGRRLDFNPMDKLMDNIIPHSIEVMNPMEWLGL